MNSEERKQEARVWECCRDDADKWQECHPEPDGFREGWKYRIRPAPAPEPLPCCSCCGDKYPRQPVNGVGRYACNSCGVVWDQCRRVPCPTCADLRERITELLAELSELHGKEVMETVEQLRAQASVQDISYTPAPEALPCPFCGCKETDFWPNARRCHNCYASATEEAWNHRVPCLKCDWKQHRLDALQSAQSKMRDPERTMVCDILANGTLLAEPNEGRYEVAPCSNCARLIELGAQQNDTCREAAEKLKLAHAHSDAVEAELRRWKDSHRAVVKQRDDAEAKVAELRALLSGDEGERAAKMQARMDKSLAALRHGKGVLSTDRWVHVLRTSWDAAIRELEGKDHA